MLENLYLCGIKNNAEESKNIHERVVICLKICTFVASKTTLALTKSVPNGCDLLENLYLCGIKNNYKKNGWIDCRVVICLKICTFVASKTTQQVELLSFYGCDLLENLYLCGIKNNVKELMIPR